MTRTYELFERYLSAVRKYLPWKGQDDILAELRANLEAQLEDREAELGRGLTEAEMADWLKRLGSPMQVAGPYQPQRYLIGPTLFPMLWYVLRIALVCATGIYGLVNIVLIALTVQGAPTVAQVLLRYPGVLMSVATWVTLIFVALEFAAGHFPEKFPRGTWMSAGWNPATLPAVEKPHKGCGAKSYAQAVAEVLFGYIALIWLILIPHHPFLLMGPGAEILRQSPFAPAPVWREFYWLILALNVVQVAWNGFRLWRGSWREPALIQRAVYKLMGLVPLVVLMTAPGHLLAILKDPDVDAARYAATLATVNVSAHRVIQVMCAIVIVQMVVETAQGWMKEYRGRVARA